MRDEHLFAFAGLSDVASERVGDERVAKEREAVRAGFILVADAVRRGDVHAIRNRVRSLHRAPGIHLGLPPFGALGGMPADGSGVEQHLRAKQ